MRLELLENKVARFIINLIPLFGILLAVSSLIKWTFLSEKEIILMIVIVCFLVFLDVQLTIVFLA